MSQAYYVKDARSKQVCDIGNPLKKTFYYKIQIILNKINIYYENSFVYIF